MNKKIIYLSIFLVLALFLISSCSQVKGIKMQQDKVADEETEGIITNDEGISGSEPRVITGNKAFYSCWVVELAASGSESGGYYIHTSYYPIESGECVLSRSSSKSCDMMRGICESHKSSGAHYVGLSGLISGRRSVIISTFFELEPIGGWEE